MKLTPCVVTTWTVRSSVAPSNQAWTAIFLGFDVHPIWVWNAEFYYWNLLKSYHTLIAVSANSFDLLDSIQKARKKKNWRQVEGCCKQGPSWHQVSQSYCDLLDSGWYFFTMILKNFKIAHWICLNGPVRRYLSCLSVMLTSLWFHLLQWWDSLHIL